MVRLLYIMIFFLMPFNLWAASVSLYILPYVSLEQGKPLLLSHCLRVEGRADDIQRLLNIEVPEALYDDGLLDRREIRDLAAEQINGHISIFGTSTRVVNSKNRPEVSYGAIVIKRGNSVRVTAATGAISIEIVGVAQSQGRRGDIIPVKVNGTKTIRGRILDSRNVRVEL